MLLTLQQQKTAKELLPAILSVKPCSVKDIQKELLLRHNRKVSVQAIYKILEGLVSKQVVLKNKGTYGLHKEWVSYLEMISKKAKLNGEKKEFINPQHVNVETLIFRNLLELDMYCSDLHTHHYGNEKEICSMYRHHWWHLVYPLREYASTNGNSRYYCVCTSNTALDAQGSNFKKKLGMHVLHKKVPLHGELEVHEEFVVEKFIPSGIQGLLDDFFAKTKSVVDFDIKELMNILKKECEIVVVINRNITLANELRNQVKKMFSGMAQ